VQRRIARNRAAAVQRRAARGVVGEGAIWPRLSAAPAPPAEPAAPALASPLTLEPEPDTSAPAAADDVCALCQAALAKEGVEVQALECTHAFHKVCIQEWMSCSGLPLRYCCPHKCFRDRHPAVVFSDEEDTEPPRAADGATATAAPADLLQLARAMASASTEPTHAPPSAQAESTSPNDPEAPRPPPEQELEQPEDSQIGDAD
jgi:hypothetical protein